MNVKAPFNDRPRYPPRTGAVKEQPTDCWLTFVRSGFSHRADTSLFLSGSSTAAFPKASHQVEALETIGRAGDYSDNLLRSSKIERGREGGEGRWNWTELGEVDTYVEYLLNKLLHISYDAALFVGSKLEAGRFVEVVSLLISSFLKYMFADNVRNTYFDILFCFCCHCFGYLLELSTFHCFT